MKLSKIPNLIKNSALSVRNRKYLKQTCSDIFEAEKRWTKPLEEYVPIYAEGSEIPSHHYINGYNSSIRRYFKDMKSIKGKFKFLKYLGLRIDVEKVQKIIKLIKRIDSEFLSLPPLEKDCIVYRGRRKSKWSNLQGSIDFKIVNKAKAGDIIIPDTAYSYCAFEKSFAEIWCPKKQKGCETIMYIIRLPKGAKVSRNPEHGGEVLMPRNAAYKVIAKNKKYNHTEIVLEYQLPKSNNITGEKTL